MRLILAMIALGLLAAPAAGQTGPALAGRMAQADNAAVVNSNPAGITRVRGTQVVLDASVASSFSRFRVRGGTTTSGGNPDDDNDPFVIPTFSLSHELSERWRLGFGVFVPAGIGTDYGSEWAGRYYATSSSLVFVNMQPVIAYQASDWLSLAAGASIMYVDSVAESAFNNLQPGLADGRVKLEVDGLDAGAIVAAMLEPWEGTRFAISYRSEQTPDLEGRAHFRNLGPLLEAALGSAGLLGAKIDLGVNVPQAIQAGFYHEFESGLSVMGDVTWMDWSRFGRVDVSVSQFSVTTRSHYNDIWIGSFGIQYPLKDDLGLAMGASYVSSAVDDADRTVSLPFDEIFYFGIGGYVRARSNLEIHANLGATVSGNGRIDQQSNPLAGRLRGRTESPYSVVFQVSLVWGTKPIGRAARSSASAIAL